MNYKVLYRKYRPQVFDEVLGQDSQINTLKSAIVNDKISHAYIFSGPRGTGKTSTAKIFAKAINCSQNIDGNPCGKCANCLEFTTSSDIYEIDAASNNGVDQVREIIDNIKLSPINSKYKVYIIDEVHMLSTSAFNALLLTLEEPPAHVVFILATTNIESVPITVLSRCQRLDFKKIGSTFIVKELRHVCEEENILIDEEALMEIADYSDGGMRDALGILDQLSKSNEKISVDMIRSNLGLVSNKDIKDLIDSIEQSNSSFIIETINSFKDKALDFKGLIKKIIKECLNRAISLKTDEDNFLLSYDDYKKLAFEVNNLLCKTNISVSSFDMLLLVLLSFIKDNRIVNEEVNVVKKDKELTKKEDFSTKNYFPGNNFIDARVNNCFIKASKNALNKAKNDWEIFLNSLEDKKIKGKLIDVSVVLSSDDIIVLKTDYESNAVKINEIIEAIEKKYNELFNSNFKFVSISVDRWNKEMDLYKEELKNGVKKSYIEEIAEKENKNLSSVFDNSKIEIV